MDETVVPPPQGIARAIGAVERRFGRGVVLRLGREPPPSVEGISTGAPSLDLALGGRGIPRGRMVELFGSESTGKTTLALHAAASAQAGGGVVVYIDAEHALDPGYAARLGVDVSNLLVSQPMTGEEALEIAEILSRSLAVDLIVVDSVAALLPRAELEGNLSETLPGLQARLMSSALRRLNAALHRTRTAILFLNQIREKIGVFFGNPETTPGGRALKFYAAARIELKRTASVKRGEATVGLRIEARVVKNKLYPPFRRAEFDLLFDRGIDRAMDLLDAAARLGALKNPGPPYAFEGTPLGRSREDAAAALRADRALFDRVWAATRETHARGQ